ncbi:pyridoxamine 5'-phosphate oxidase family protein [Chloroflexota bacterium]
MTRDDVIALIKECHFGYLATVDVDNAPCVRPVGMDTVYDDGVYFFTFSNTRKANEISGNPMVEVAWCKPADLAQVRIRGKAEPVTDEAVIKRFKGDNPIVAKVVPSQAEQLFALYKITPSKVYMTRGLVPYEEVAW